MWSTAGWRPWKAFCRQNLRNQCVCGSLLLFLLLLGRATFLGGLPQASSDRYRSPKSLPPSFRTVHGGPLRVALALSGGIRTFALCAPAFRRHVLDAAPSLVVYDVFADVTLAAVEPNEVEREGLAALRALPELQALRVRPATFVARLAQERADAASSARGLQPQEPCGPKELGCAPGALAMFDLMAGADALVAQGEARRRQPYPAVVRLRPDHMWHAHLDLLPCLSAVTMHDVDTSGAAPGPLCLPWWHDGQGLAFDQMAAGGREAMRAYAAAFETAASLLASGERLAAPEAVLYRHLTAAGLRSLSEFPIEVGLLRGAGREDDPYAKLARDFPMAAPYPTFVPKAADGWPAEHMPSAALDARLTTPPVNTAAAGKNLRGVERTTAKPEFSAAGEHLRNRDGLNPHVVHPEH